MIDFFYGCCINDTYLQTITKTQVVGLQYDTFERTLCMQSVVKLSVTGVRGLHLHGIVISLLNHHSNDQTTGYDFSVEQFVIV